MARRQVSIFINGKEVANQIKSITAEKRKLTRELGQMTIGSREYEQQIKQINKLDGIIDQHRGKVRGVQSAWDKVKGSAGMLAGAAGIGGIVLSAEMAADAIKEIVTETKALRREITQLTGASGEELDSLTTRIGGITKTFGAEQRDVLQAANTLVKEFGISYDEAFDQIEKGFLMGANVSGDFLDNVKEYSTQFREAGFSAEEFAAIAIRAQREGIFSDKGLDVVKEFGLRIREQTKAAATAMENAFGKEFTDEIFGGINDGSITTADALQRVAKEMNNAEIPAKDLQTVIADVFGGAGEDAGLRYIQSLQDIQDETLNTIADTDGYIAAQAELLKAVNTLVKEFGGSYDQSFAAIEKGFLQGANASGELLENIKEYSTQFREAGFSVEEFLAINVRAQREGIFSDKGLDVVKEFGLRIREQTKAAATAMENAFGKGFTDQIFGGINDGSLTTADALQRVAAEMNNTEIPAKDLQTVIADLFGGPGEDAGLRYIQSLQDIQDETLNTIQDTDGYIAAQAELLAANQDLAAAENELTKQLETTGDSLTLVWTRIKTVALESVSSIIEIFRALPIKIKASIAAIKQQFSNIFGGEEDARSATSVYYETLVNETKKQETRVQAVRDQAAAVQQAKEAAQRQERIKRKTADEVKAQDREIERLEKQEQRLAEIIAKFKEEQALTELSEDDKKLERLRQQYQKQIDLAKELEAQGSAEATQQRLELERLQQLAVDELRAQLLQESFDKKQEQLAEQEMTDNLRGLEELERRAAFEQQVREMLRTEQEQAIYELDLHYAEILAKAEQYGMDTTELTRKYETEKQAIEKEFQQKSQEELLQSQRAKLAVLQNNFQAFGEMAASLGQLFGEEGRKSAVFQKALTLTQIALDTASAISSLTAASEANPANAVTFGAAGIAQFVSGLARIVANVAQAKKVLKTATVPQRFTGGFTDVIGATDGRKYSARYIGDPPTGMLNYNSPILTASGVLGNERGPEYFVSAADVQRPAVLDHIRAIENITRARQFQEGGATAPLPSSNSPSMPPEMLQLLQNINSTLLLIQQTPRQPLIGDDEIIRLDKRNGKLRAVSGGTV